MQRVPIYMAKSNEWNRYQVTVANIIAIGKFDNIDFYFPSDWINFHSLLLAE